MTYPGPSTTTYAFDAFGNRTSMTTSAGTTAYTSDDADRITEVQPPSPAPAIAYDWDDNGNLVERGSDTFEWDYEDRLVEATVNSVTTAFAYSGDGLRDSRTVGMTTTTFTWDINAGLPVVLDDGNQYLYGAGLAAMKQSGNWYYYLADGLGSTMAIVDADGDVQNGYTYDVYGEPTVTGSLANEFDFAGQQTDGSTGLQYLRARYYDPETGVFLSRDPLARLEAWTEQSLAYALGNPTLRTDPTGLDSPEDDWKRATNPCHWGIFPSKICGKAQGYAEDLRNKWAMVGEYAQKNASQASRWLRDFSTECIKAIEECIWAMSGVLDALTLVTMGGFIIGAACGLGVATGGLALGVCVEGLIAGAAAFTAAALIAAQTGESLHEIQKRAAENP